MSGLKGFILGSIALAAFGATRVQLEMKKPSRSPQSLSVIRTDVKILNPMFARALYLAFHKSQKITTLGQRREFTIDGALRCAAYVRNYSCHLLAGQWEVSETGDSRNKLFTPIEPRVATVLFEQMVAKVRLNGGSSYFPPVKVKGIYASRIVRQVTESSSLSCMRDESSQVSGRPVDTCNLINGMMPSHMGASTTIKKSGR